MLSCVYLFSLFFDLFYVCRLCNCTFFLTFVLTGLTCFVFLHVVSIYCFVCCIICFLFYLLYLLELFYFLGRYEIWAKTPQILQKSKTYIDISQHCWYSWNCLHVPFLTNPRVVSPNSLNTSSAEKCWLSEKPVNRCLSWVRWWIPCIIRFLWLPFENRGSEMRTVSHGF